MSFVNTLSNRLGNFFGLGAKKQQSPINSKQPLLTQLQTYVYRAKMEVEVWRRAIDLALNSFKPSRFELLNIYREARWDSELIIAINNALIDIQAAPFLILNSSESEDKTAKELFKKAWFMEFLRMAFEEQLYGFSVVEFDPNHKRGEEIKLIYDFPRQHFDPHQNKVLRQVNDINGIELDKLKEAGIKLLVLQSSSQNLGLLSIASLSVIRKNYNLTDWSIHNEKLGQPFVWLQTETRDAKELNRRKEFLSQFNDNNWGIGDLQEKFTFIEPGNVGNRHLSYKDFIDYIDNSITRLINGQSGTTQNEAWTGTANVHERVMGQYTKSRLTRIQHFINDSLFPFLIEEGYKLEGLRFQFTEIWENAPKPIPKEPTVNDPNDPTQLASKKKSCCEIDHNADRVSLESKYYELFSISDIFEKVIKNIFDDKIKKNELSEDIWKYNVQELWNGVKDGFGAEYSSNPDSELIKQLKQNVYVFSAFKNHANMQAIAALLVDANNKPRSFDDFKKEALQVSANYNVHYLASEYQLANRSANMAVEWQKLEKNKDLLPNIKYLTANDDRVREAHAKLDEVVLPIEHDFWDNFFPPNGWGCRCYVEATDEPIKEPTVIPDEKQVPLSMRFNPGKEKKIVSDDNEYYDVTIPERKRIEKQMKQFIKNNPDLI